MHKVEKYSKIFATSLNVSSDKINEKLKYNEIDEWDSIGHMTLIAGLEEEYKITFETDDIIEFSSFKKGIEILKKYKIDISLK
jgi:acyl carrier protein